MPATLKRMNLITFIAKVSLPGILRILLNTTSGCNYSHISGETYCGTPGGAIDEELRVGPFRRTGFGQRGLHALPGFRTAQQYEAGAKVALQLCISRDIPCLFSEIPLSGAAGKA